MNEHLSKFWLHYLVGFCFVWKSIGGWIGLRSGLNAFVMTGDLTLIEEVEEKIHPGMTPDHFALPPRPRPEPSILNLQPEISNPATAPATQPKNEEKTPAP